MLLEYLDRDILMSAGGHLKEAFQSVGVRVISSAFPFMATGFQLADHSGWPMGILAYCSRGPGPDKGDSARIGRGAGEVLEMTAGWEVERERTCLA